jgi:septum formation protein
VAERLRLILASKSPRRRLILKALGIPFQVMPSHIPENTTETRPARLVQELALRKAEAVAKRAKHGIVLGADTVVVLGEQILGQPKDSDDAYRMLYRLSGTTHRVFTGVVVLNAASGKRRVSYAVSTVRMKRLPIDRLLQLSRKNLDKAGAYAIQSQHDPIAKVIKGAYDNVVGLPLKLVKQLLQPYRREIARPRR